jgi:hypothetical protein
LSQPLDTAEFARTCLHRLPFDEAKKRWPNTPIPEEKK